MDWCKKSGAKNGSISTLPEVPGVLLFLNGHVGVYIGGGYAVEARGFAYGVVMTKVAGRGWKNWAYIPSSVIEYDTDPSHIVSGAVSTIQSVEDSFGKVELKKGMKGDDVKLLQTKLMALGYQLPRYGADGDYGTETSDAVKAFQKDHNLKQTGVFGEAEFAALNVKPAKMYIEVTGSKVNVRNKPDTSTGKVMFIAKKGDKLEYVGTDAHTGWYKLADGNYISNQYSVKI